MKPGQHNKRGRGRGRRHGGGGSGGGGGGGGNPVNRVYESNGPDVKVRGTAQTIADKYLQLGRDAQASGDTVMAESYYQFAEHYLRIVAAAQAYNQQMQQQYRRPEEDQDDDGEDSAEGDGDEGHGLAAAGEESTQPGLGEQPDIETREAAPAFQPREPQEPREGGRRERFRPRWQDRRDRHGDQGSDFERRASSQRSDGPREQQANGRDRDAEPGQWEAPSFLRRPAPAPAAEAESGEAEQRPRPERRARRDRSEPGRDAADSDPVSSAD